MDKKLEKLKLQKDEAYSRPEKYPFERTKKLTRWAKQVLKPFQK